MRNLKTFYTKVGTAILMLLSIFLCGNNASASTAEEMDSSCRFLYQSPVQDGNIVIRQDFETGECWGAFQALQAVTQFYDSQTRKALLSVCVPSGVSESEYLKIFHKYLADNPAKGHEEFSAVAWESLIRAFPCGYNKNSPQ